VTYQQADVLLAEDNPSDAELILGCLATVVDRGRIHRVGDGVEALDFLFCRGDYSARDPESPLRLVLIDIKLPRVDGLAVLDQLRADPDMGHVPVVILSSSNVARDVVEAYRQHANGYVQKPVDFRRFREVVTALGTYWLTINEPLPTMTPAGLRQSIHE